MRLVGRVLTPLLLTVLLVLPGTGPIAAAAAQTVPEPPPPLVITEVMQDNAGTPNDQDWFEYFEVHNPTDADIDF
ncbi:MAG: lamin tail domain-containing protein, partial [Microbacteriaceae bacterium]|nr:lamin tail domain-containing protein [Microbacteriaceae bacterium]